MRFVAEYVRCRLRRDYASGTRMRTCLDWMPLLTLWIFVSLFPHISPDKASISTRKGSVMWWTYVLILIISLHALFLLIDHIPTIFFAYNIQICNLCLVSNHCVIVPPELKELRLPRQAHDLISPHTKYLTDLESTDKFTIHCTSLQKSLRQGCNVLWIQRNGSSAHVNL